MILNIKEKQVCYEDYTRHLKRQKKTGVAITGFRSFKADVLRKRRRVQRAILKSKKHEESKNKLDVTYYFIVHLIGSTCFGHYCAHHQELATMMLITILVVPFLVCCRLEVRCG